MGGSRRWHGQSARQELEGGLRPACGGGPDCAGPDGQRGRSAVVTACSGAERYPWLGLVAKASLGASTWASSYSQLLSPSGPIPRARRCHINHHQRQEICWDSPTHLCYLHRQPHFFVCIKRAFACQDYRFQYKHSFLPCQRQALTRDQAEERDEPNETLPFGCCYWEVKWGSSTVLFLPSCWGVTTAFPSSCKIGI